MEFFIENDYVKVGSVNLGAELSSIVLKSTGEEYLWQAGDLWKRKSPVLFPVVGNCKNKVINVDGKSYDMVSHGFAKAQNFEMIQQDSTCISYQLTSNEETRKFYPFEFNFFVTYTLIGNKIDVNFEVENLDSKPIYFSVGGHTAFNCNSLGVNFDDWYVEFEKNETVGRYFKGALLDSNPSPFFENSNIINLSKEVFEKDALIFKNLQSSYATLKNKINDKSVKVSLAGFPVTIIWSKGDGFCCIEPCAGCDDNAHFNGNFAEKELINKVNVGETFNKSFTIKIK